MCWQPLQGILITHIELGRWKERSRNLKKFQFHRQIPRSFASTSSSTVIISRVPSQRETLPRGLISTGESPLGMNVRGGSNILRNGGSATWSSKVRTRKGFQLRRNHLGASRSSLYELLKESVGRASDNVFYSGQGLGVGRAFKRVRILSSIASKCRKVGATREDSESAGRRVSSGELSLNLAHRIQTS